jgi:hypothetical protein
MRRREVIIGVVAAAIVVIVLAVYMLSSDRWAHQGRLLPYRVLHEDTGGEKVSLSALVEPDSPQEEVMELARHLRDRYGRYSQILINIYDSEEVWRKHRDESHSSEELYEHWLVHMLCDKEDGYDEIHWMQEKE